MKTWLTAQEIADEKLPYLPETKRGVAELAYRENWDAHPFARKRQGRGGGMEYHFQILPVTAQMAYMQRYKVIGSDPPPTLAERPDSRPLSDRAKRERDARIIVLDAFKDFNRGFQARGRTQVSALHLFSVKYNNQSVAVEKWVREAVPTVSQRTLLRWKELTRFGDKDRLAVDRSEASKGKGLLDTANGGLVKAHILGLIAHQPHLSAKQVLMLCRAEFGDELTDADGVMTPVPPLRTFQHFLKGLKENHQVELMKLTNPDRFRATMLPSGTGMYSHITDPNALWMIDASPIDALCTDGRHSVYVCIDIATRRFITYISRTPRASAVGLMLRKAILAWGVPKTIVTDNGSDFVAQETVRLFRDIDAEPMPSDAYSPAQKGHVERSIGTWQRGFVSLLPGYVGHSVSDRKAIEDRKSFAHRLGQDTAETFAVSLSAADFQKRSDAWCLDYYQHQEHGGLDGVSPANKAALLAATIRTVDERALDVLLMPALGGNGTRRITKFGVRIDGFYYRAAWMMPKTDVFVRMDPNDKGRIHLFSPSRGLYLGEGICPELAGIHPQTFEKARKERNAELIKEKIVPIQREIKRIIKGPLLIDKVLEVARRDIPNVIVLPRREERHETPELIAALDVGKSRQPGELTEAQKRIAAEIAADLDPVQRATAPKHANVEPLRTNTTPAQRFAKALDIQKRFKISKELVEEADLSWLVSYASSPEFKARMALHEHEFGEQAPVQLP